jgi:hypothetical protein
MKKVKAIQEWKQLLIQKMFRSLLDVANYYDCLIREFSTVAKTLSDLFRKWLSREWD